METKAGLGGQEKRRRENRARAKKGRGERVVSTCLAQEQNEVKHRKWKPNHHCSSGASPQVHFNGKAQHMNGGTSVSNAREEDLSRQTRRLTRSSPKSDDIGKSLQKPSNIRRRGGGRGEGRIERPSFRDFPASTKSNE